MFAPQLEVLLSCGHTRPRVSGGTGSRSSTAHDPPFQPASHRQPPLGSQAPLSEQSASVAHGGLLRVPSLLPLADTAVHTVSKTSICL